MNILQNTSQAQLKDSLPDNILNPNWKPPLPDIQMEAAYATIRASLEKNDKGTPLCSLQNFSIALQNDPILSGHIRRNLFTEKMDINCELPWIRTSTTFDDTDMSFLLLHMESQYGLKGEKTLMHALKIASTNESFHPVRDKLLSLEWDGVPRVRFVLRHFLGADISDFNENCLKVFMFGAVNRVFRPGSKFELMLVLAGGQDAGKTTFVRYLAMDEEWFSDDIRNISDEKVFHHLNGHWIMEMSEMVATANAKSIEEIKSFLTRTKDTYKFPYDRYAADHLRQCVFGGTTNRMDLLPSDRSGNRRFLPVQVHPEMADVHILDDEAASRAYIDQLWAEIMTIYDSGDYSVHLSKDMEKQLAHEQERFMQEDTEAGLIYDYFDQYQGDKICSIQIYKEALGHENDDPKQWETREIREIVNRGIETGDIQGWRAYSSSRRYDKYGTQRGWERIPVSDAAEPASAVNAFVNKPVDKYEQIGFTVVKNDPDCPF